MIRSFSFLAPQTLVQDLPAGFVCCPSSVCLSRPGATDSLAGRHIKKGGGPGPAAEHFSPSQWKGFKETLRGITRRVKFIKFLSLQEAAASSAFSTFPQLTVQWAPPSLLVSYQPVSTELGVISVCPFLCVPRQSWWLRMGLGGGGGCAIITFPELVWFFIRSP